MDKMTVYALIGKKANGEEFYGGLHHETYEQACASLGRQVIKNEGKNNTGYYRVGKFLVTEVPIDEAE